MCISLPGKVVKVVGNDAVVSYGELGESRVQNLVSAGVGEWVYVTQGMAVQIVPEKDALIVLKGLG